LGTFANVNALTPVTSSGNDVTVASRIRPTQLPDRPLLSADDIGITAQLGARQTDQYGTNGKLKPNQ